MGARHRGWWALAVATGLWAAHCNEVEPEGPLSPTLEDGGSLPDAGSGGADAGTPGPGLPDGGLADAGATDGGQATVPLPTLEGWQFFGPEQGAPREVYGVTADEGGNLWVAGGEEGLFLLRPGDPHLRRFTLEHGLRPYGFMPDGSAPPGPYYLKVLSVAGGPPGTVFVGYAGRPGRGQEDCEVNWDTPALDPSRYKSGDADRVTLRADGTLEVVHYDIFSGPGVVRDEMRGRERLCDILRIAYDRNTQSVWFGANHGFARGDARYPGQPGCNGQLHCSGVQEHVHPAINALDGQGRIILLTDAYYGVAVDPSGDVWFGGSDRSTRFRYGSNNRNYWQAQLETESASAAWNRLDIWPDRVGEPGMSRPEERVPDDVSSMSVAADGTVWVGSFTQGLAQLDSQGQVLRRLRSQLVAPHVAAVAADPLNGSVWVGARWGGGLSRVRGDSVSHYGYALFGPALTSSPVVDLQVDRSGPRRRLLVAFQGTPSVPGVVGIYSGE